MGQRAYDEFEQYDFNKYTGITVLQKSIVRTQDISRRSGWDILQGKGTGGLIWFPENSLEVRSEYWESGLYIVINYKWSIGKEQFVVERPSWFQAFMSNLGKNHNEQ